MFSSDEVVCTTPRVKKYYGVNIKNPIRQLQIVQAKLLSDQNMLYSILFAYHKYHFVKCLVVGRRIFGRNVVRGWHLLDNSQS